MILQVGLGLLLAIVLSNMRAGNWLQAALLPAVRAVRAAVAVIWFYIFNPDNGLLTSALHWVGLDVHTRWLADPPGNTFAMIVAAMWQGLGPAMVLFLVGLQNLPREPIEAARVDGAEGFTLFRHITFPLLRPTTAVVVAITLDQQLQGVRPDLGDDPGRTVPSSETLAVTMYRESFVSFSVGYGASVAVVLTVIVLVLSVFYLRSMFRKVEADR